MKALVHGTLIDGTGTDPVSNATVIVDDDGRIADAGAGIEPPRGTKVIDVSGRTIIPGLIDCHVHFFVQVGRSMQEEALTPLTLHVFEAAERARATLDAGFTCPGYWPDAPRVQNGSTAWFDRVAQIEHSGYGHEPDGWPADFFLPSGQQDPIAAALSNSIEWPNRVCDGIDGVMKTTREILRAGADFIKICTTGGVMSPEDEPSDTQFTREEIAAIVYEARAKGKYVAAHAQGLEGIKSAMECGVRTIEYGIYVDEETADDMVRRGIYLAPTFHSLQGIFKAEEANPGSILPQALRKAREVGDIHRTNIRMAIERGVKVAMGTDAGVGLHGTNAEELTYLVDQGGMSPMDAIVAATKTAAECNRMDDEVGTLKEGMSADLLVVDGDPLADISILEEKSNLLMIVQGGDAYKDLITT